MSATEAAARMAVFSEDPTHFDRWFRETGEAASDPEALLDDGRALYRQLAPGFRRLALGNSPLAETMPGNWANGARIGMVHPIRTLFIPFVKERTP